MARKRFNPNAICSSNRYSESKKAHALLLKENHENLNENIAKARSLPSEKVNFNAPVTTYRTIYVFGKPMKLTEEEYQKYYLDNH